MPEDPFYEDQPINELDNDVMGAMIKATRPDVGGVDFKRYENKGKSDTIKTVIEKNEKNQVSKKERVAAAKDRYQIKNHFAPAPKGKKKKSAKP